MTTFTQAVDAADALTDQLQEFTSNPRYLPRFFDTFFGLRATLGSANDRFAGLHSGKSGDLPVFATVFDHCEQAKAIGTALTPGDAAVSRYASAVRRAIAAMGGRGGTSARPALRSALRLRSGSAPTARGGRQPGPAPEPYYARAKSDLTESYGIPSRAKV